MILPHQSVHTRVMGILNVTPDSFSDGGRFQTPADAIRRAYRLIEEGADAIDVGAESTRPGHMAVTWQEEWKRLQPVLQELSRNMDIFISVDTSKVEIATRALEYGVSMINDVSGLLLDPDILKVVAQAQCDYVWMHNRRTTPQGNGLLELIDETKYGIATALEAGIEPSKLWIDPGIGFAKTHHQNLLALRTLPEYCQLGYKVLLGASRKRVTKSRLELPVEERLEPSLAIVSLGVLSGVSAVRVHDVRSTVKTCRMVEEIIDAKTI